MTAFALMTTHPFPFLSFFNSVDYLPSICLEGLVLVFVCSSDLLVLDCSVLRGFDKKWFLYYAHPSISTSSWLRVTARSVSENTSLLEPTRFLHKPSISSRKITHGACTKNEVLCSSQYKDVSMQTKRLVWCFWFLHLTGFNEDMQFWFDCQLTILTAASGSITSRQEIHRQQSCRVPFSTCTETVAV
jgi:hypothetical protein